MIQLTQKTRNPNDQSRHQASTGFDQLIKRKDLGFHQVTQREALWRESFERAQVIRGRSERLVVLGIGGSSLGTRAGLQALSLKGVEVFENVDGFDFWTRIEDLGDLSNVDWVIISKSGGTLETLGQAAFLSEYLHEKGLKLADRCTVISERKSNPLTDWAKENQVEVLELSQDIGGRFSVLTPVGLFAFAFAGANLEDLRKGASWALENKDLCVDLTAQTLESFRAKEFVTLFWTYCNRLRDYGLWIQQIWAESLAKREDRKGNSGPEVSTPVPLVGANDQHSVLQQVQEGRRDKFVWFFRVKESEEYGPALKTPLFSNQEKVVGKRLGDLLRIEQQATAEAIGKEGVHSLTLTLDRLDSASLGALFMLMELVVGALGESLDIDAFNQPGVEIGKKIAKSLM